jgi:hypothetical protein
MKFIQLTKIRVFDNKEELITECWINCQNIVYVQNLNNKTYIYLNGMNDPIRVLETFDSVIELINQQDA